MPLLQVKDCAEELYNPLREMARRNHRSIAGETLVAIEEHVFSNVSRDADRSVKSDRRRRALDVLATSNDSFEGADFVAMIHEARDER